MQLKKKVSSTSTCLSLVPLGKEAKEEASRRERHEGACGHSSPPFGHGGRTEAERTGERKGGWNFTDVKHGNKKKKVGRKRAKDFMELKPCVFSEAENMSFSSWHVPLIRKYGRGKERWTSEWARGSYSDYFLGWTQIDRNRSWEMTVLLTHWGSWRKHHEEKGQSWTSCLIRYHN